MTVGLLQKQLNLLIKKKFLKKDDEVILIGTGDKKSSLLSATLMPKMKMDMAELLECDNPAKGFYCIGFMDNLEKCIEDMPIGIDEPIVGMFDCSFYNIETMKSQTDEIYEGDSEWDSPPPKATSLTSIEK